jgi:hypothetical protein
VPPYLYSAVSFPVNDVPNKVNTYVGIGKITAPVVTFLEQDEMIATIAIYPNPTEGFVQLSKTTKWILANGLGESILEGNSNQLDLTTFASGMYFLKTENKVKKIQKK